VPGSTGRQWLDKRLLPSGVRPGGPRDKTGVTSEVESTLPE